MAERDGFLLPVALVGLMDVTGKTLNCSRSFPGIASRQRDHCYIVEDK